MATKVERWAAEDGTGFATCKAAEEHDFIETAVTLWMAPAAWPHGRELLRKMIAAGYGFVPPPMANPPA